MSCKIRFDVPLRRQRYKRWVLWIIVTSKCARIVFYLTKELFRITLQQLIIWVVITWMVGAFHYILAYITSGQNEYLCLIVIWLPTTYSVDPLHTSLQFCSKRHIVSKLQYHNLVWCRSAFQSIYAWCTDIKLGIINKIKASCHLLTLKSLRLFTVMLPPMGGSGNLMITTSSQYL